MPTRAKKKIYYKRKFLNKPGWHSTAVVLAEMSDRTYEDWKTKEKVYDFDTELTISDCNRLISLSLESHSESAIKNSLYKLRLLKQVITDLEQHFTTAAEKRIASIKLQDEHEKKRKQQERAEARRNRANR